MLSPQIHEETQADFEQMSIPQFSSLLKASRIHYPSKMVEDFLSQYIIQPNVKINNLTWHSFISEIVARFSGARNHLFLLDFLEKVSEGYLASKREQEFIVDLLQLKVPLLFALEQGTEEAAEKEDKEVARKFTVLVRGYIIKHSIPTPMTAILVCYI